MTINRKTINKNPQTPKEDNGNLYYWTSNGSLKNNNITNDKDKWYITSGKICMGNHFWRKKRTTENNMSYFEDDIDVI